MSRPASIWHDSPTCSVVLERLAPKRVLISLLGRDLGALGSKPLSSLERLLNGDDHELFFDLSEAQAATLDVSASWAIWLRANRARLSRVCLLPRAPMIRLSAETVSRFSQLGSRAVVYRDPVAFERALHA